MSSDLVEYVESFEIDNKRRITAFQQKKGKTLSYPDHYSLSLTFKGIPLKRNKISFGKKFTAWNTNRVNGWATYKELTTNNVKLDRIASECSNDPDIIMNSIVAELNRIKYIAFGKVKVRKKIDNKLDELDELIAKKAKLYVEDSKSKMSDLEEKISKELQKKQKQNIENEISNLKSIRESKGKSASVFRLKEKIVGKKKASDGPSVVLDPKTNNPIFKPSSILKASVDYCKQLLTNDEPKDDFDKDLKLKRMVHDVRMKEAYNEDYELTEEMFADVLKKLRRKCGGKYKFILQSGNSLKSALFKLYKVVWETEQKPDSW